MTGDIVGVNTIILGETTIQSDLSESRDLCLHRVSKFRNMAQSAIDRCTELHISFVVAVDVVLVACSDGDGCKRPYL